MPHKDFVRTNQNPRQILDGQNGVLVAFHVPSGRAPPVVCTSRVLRSPLSQAKPLQRRGQRAHTRPLHDRS